MFPIYYSWLHDEPCPDCGNPERKILGFTHPYTDQMFTLIDCENCNRVESLNQAGLNPGDNTEN